jgi:hypothetical protein
MEHIYIDESRSDASVTKVEIVDSDSQFCWCTSSTVGASENFRSATQNRTPEITLENNETVYMQQIFLCCNMLKKITHSHCKDHKNWSRLMCSLALHSEEWLVRHLVKTYIFFLLHAGLMHYILFLNWCSWCISVFVCHLNCGYFPFWFGVCSI